MPLILFGLLYCRHVASEEEIRRRVDEQVAKKVSEELKKQNEYVEGEVARRVQDIKKHLEQVLGEEHQKATAELEQSIANLKVKLINLQIYMYHLCTSLLVSILVKQIHSLLMCEISV